MNALNPALPEMICNSAYDPASTEFLAHPSLSACRSLKLLQDVIRVSVVRDRRMIRPMVQSHPVS
jgi:hypothetical protein